MDSDALQTFVAIHEAGSFSGAAEQLHRSQPAISRRIALLEAEVGAPLFERATGGVTLSLAGRALLPHAERTLGALRDAAQAMLALKDPAAGPVSLAVVGTLAGTRLSAVLRQFADQRPGVSLTLRTATSAEVGDLVRRGEAAVGLRYRPDTSPDLESLPLAPERTVVVASPAHPLAGRTVALEMLRHEMWLAFPDAMGPGEPSSQSIFAHFLARGVGEVRWTPADSLTAQKRLAEAGFGMVLLQESAVAEELARGSLAVIGVEGLEAVNPVFAVVRREGYLNAAARGLLALLQAQAAWT